MNKVIETDILRHDSFEYIRIHDYSNYTLELFMAYDSVIIESNNRDFVEKLVRSIRTHNNTDIYLKPIFLLKSSKVEDPLINNLIDGVIFSLDQLELISDYVKQILLRIKDFVFVKSISLEADIISRTINLMVSREKTELFAYLYLNSGLGYIYPESSIQFSPRDEHNILAILDTAEGEGLFTSDFNDRIYLCTSCQTGILSYREVCPKCSSANSKAEDLVHHFSCAYVGPVSDFKNAIDDELNCPKCNKYLNHIGVDYDKPSLLHTCNRCDHKYQDYHVKAKCITCHHDNDVQNLLPRTIKNFYLTKKGKNVAYHGFISTSKDFNEVPGTVRFDVFKTMLEYEIERLKQNDATSNIAYLTIANAGELYSRIGMERQKILISEMIRILRKNLRSSDFIAFYSASTLILSLNDIPTKIANNILKDVVKITMVLLKKNFKNVDIHIETFAKPLNIELSHEIQLQQLIKRFEKEN
jgi:GGDEF domain-containing protein